MWEIFKSITEELSSYHHIYQTLIIVISVFLILMAVFGIWTLRSYILYEGGLLKKIKNKKVRNKAICLKQKDLFDHDFFINTYRYRRMAENANMRYQEMSKLFRIVLVTKINSTEKYLEYFIRNYDLNEFSNWQLNAFMLQLNADIASDYNSKIKDTYKNMYGNSLGKKLYDLIMNSKEKGFNEWHDYNLKHVERIINDICKSTVFKSNVDRFNMVLYEFNSCIYSSIMDAEKAFRVFNGELDEILKNNKY